MNTESGHLINPEFYAALEKALPDVAARYEPVPDELEPAAKKKLAGRSEATVAKHSGGKLSKWASKRNQEKREARRSIEKAMKRAQRKGH